MTDIKWDKRFLELARFIATWSKDPSTKTGAVITDGRRVVSLGFNGFPRGVKDTPVRYSNRDLKYKMIVHAERNAILFARQNISACTLYVWPFMPCTICAADIIQSGIVRCVAPPCPPEKLKRWHADLDIARTMFRESGVQLDFLDI